MSLSWEQILGGLTSQIATAMEKLRRIEPDAKAILLGDVLRVVYGDTTHEFPLGVGVYGSYCENSDEPLIPPENMEKIQQIIESAADKFKAAGCTVQLNDNKTGITALNGFSCDSFSGYWLYASWESYTSIYDGYQSTYSLTIHGYLINGTRRQTLKAADGDFNHDKIITRVLAYLREHGVAK